MTSYRTVVPLLDVLRGAHVLVRPYQQGDAKDLFTAICESCDHLRPWLPFAGAHQTVEESQDWIAHQQAAWRLRSNLSVGIWTVTEQSFVGGAGLEPVNWEIGYFQVGYWVRVSATGKGFVTEAVRLLADYALAQLCAHRVEIRCSDHNLRSAAVAQRAGFTFEGALQNDPNGPVMVGSTQR
jgi:RimJ/RimL family protein N-acetyltransferase